MSTPLAFLHNFINQRQTINGIPRGRRSPSASDMMAGRTNPTFKDLIPGGDGLYENPIAPMAPGTYTPIERNPGSGFGPGLNPYLVPRKPTYFDDFNRQPDYMPPGVTPTPYLRNDGGYPLMYQDIIGSTAPGTRRGSI